MNSSPFIRKKILYITTAYASHPDLATKINSQRRVRLIKSLGYRVTARSVRHFIRIRDLWQLRRLAFTYEIIMLRVDGSQLVDTLSLLKLINPSVKIVWEVHGFPEETLVSTSLSLQLIYWRLRRLFFSLFTNAVIFVSAELQDYARRRIWCAKQTVIPNFADIGEFQKIPLYKNGLHLTHKFVVFWGGTGRYTWQAIDLIEKAAHILINNTSIQFLVITDTSWLKIRQTSNLVVESPPSRVKYLSLLKNAGVCLALYHKPPTVPFYFSPLKILDYMMAGKPTIASRFPSISQYISHNHNGILVENNPMEIVRQIKKLLTHPQYRNQLGKNAHSDAVNRFSNTVIQKKYTGLFNSL